MSSISTGVTTRQSTEFYRDLFRNDGEIVENLENRNNGFSRPSYPAPKPIDPCSECGDRNLIHDPIRGEEVCLNKKCKNYGAVISEKELGRRKYTTEMSPTEIDDMEIGIRIKENNCRGNL